MTVIDEPGDIKLGPRTMASPPGQSGYGRIIPRRMSSSRPDSTWTWLLKAIMEPHNDLQLHCPPVAAMTLAHFANDTATRLSFQTRRIGELFVTPILNFANERAHVCYAGF